MNLRALLDGKNVVLPLEEAEWGELQERLRSKNIELTMPCCKGQAYMRLSPAGTQHFVHQVDIGCKQSESEVHQLAKLEIVRACRDLELHAIPEYGGDGWRADVSTSIPNGTERLKFRSARSPSKRRSGDSKHTRKTTSVVAGSSPQFPSAKRSVTNNSHCCPSMLPPCSG